MLEGSDGGGVIPAWPPVERQAAQLDGWLDPDTLQPHVKEKSTDSFTQEPRLGVFTEIIKM